MKPRKLVRDDIKKLSSADRSIICSLYLYRCLTFRQMTTYFYLNENKKETYANWHLQELIDSAYIYPVHFDTGKQAFFLSTTGVTLAKRLFEIESTICTGAPNRCRDYHWKSSDLRIHSSKINHQIELNEFALQFAEQARKNNLQYEYYDEKYDVNKAFSSFRARPDAVIHTQNQILYIEMDLNTEGRKQLIEKWTGYRVLCDTKIFTDYVDKKPAAIIFITEGTNVLAQRKRTVLRSIEASFLDCLSNRLNFYVGSREEMLEFLFSEQEKERGRRNSDFLVSQGLKEIVPLPEILSEFEHFVQIGSISVALDFYDRTEGAILNRAIMSDKNAMLIRHATEKAIPYVIVCDHFETAINDFKHIHCFGKASLYFVDRKSAETVGFLSSMWEMGAFGDLVRIKFSKGDQ